MCCDRGDYMIMGDTGQVPVRQFIKDMPSEAEVFNRERFAFFMPQIAWGDVLAEDFGGEIPIFPTRSFRFSGTSILPVKVWQERGIRKDATVQPVDLDMIERLDRGALGIGDRFVTEQCLVTIARDLFGFRTTVGNEIVSAASGFGLSAKYASLGIDTTARLWRQGLASLACVTLIGECLERGLMPLWNCLASNEASANTALKLGMEEDPPQRESQWRPCWGKVTSSSGLWKPDELRFNSQPGTVIWRRR